MPNQLMESLLSYRMNSPLVDKLLNELGIDPTKPGGLTGELSEALEPAMIHGLAASMHP